MAMDRSDIRLRVADMAVRDDAVSEPISRGASLMLCLLLSLGLWALIWGICAYPLASLLP